MEKTELINQSPKFNPIGLMRNGHVQTISGSVFHNPLDLVNCKKIQVKVTEKSTIECEYSQSTNPKKKACVILVHGLEGSTKSNYVVSTARKLLDRGIDVIRMNMRNCGNTLHLSDTLYNAGLSNDVTELIKYSIKELGYKNVFIVGYSLGANTVLKTAGELNSNSMDELKGVVAVSPPLDLYQCSIEVIKPKNKIYDNHYLKRLKNTYRRKKEYTPELINLEILKKIKNMYDFDEYITAPSFGYKDARDYYNHNSSLNFLEPIRIKTLIIQAKDDPIIPFDSTERALKIKNPDIQYLITDFGGHVGFINGKEAAKNDIDSRWAENRIIEFVEHNL